MSYWTEMFRRRAKQHEDNERMAARQYNLSVAQHELNMQRTQMLNRAERDELEMLRAKNKSLLDVRKRTDLPRLRCYDLAGYLGRVQELLSFASFLIAREHSEASTRLRNACSVAYSIQHELLELAEVAETDAAWQATAREEMTGWGVTEGPAKWSGSQWSADELAKMQEHLGEAFKPNKIKTPGPGICAVCDNEGLSHDNCPNCGRRGA